MVSRGFYFTLSALNLPHRLAYLGLPASALYPLSGYPALTARSPYPAPSAAALSTQPHRQYVGRRVVAVPVPVVSVMPEAERIADSRMA